MTKSFASLLATLLLISGPVLAFEPPQTLAKGAFVVDHQTGAILYAKDADVKIPTASMSKVMTMLIVFDALKSGKLSLEQTLPVSEKAWKMEGSKMFIEVGKQIKVEDLIRGVIVQSGNDACVTLAEGIAGTEENFAELMNAKAKEIGLVNSNFKNSSGWPDPEHYSTPKDLSILARHLITNYPDYYKYYAETEFTYNNIRQPNRNPLLYAGIGADGIKTGHTEEAGYGLIGSAVRDGRRVDMVITGTANMQERGDEAQKLMDWALRSFRNVTLAKPGEVVEKAPVILGKSKDVELTVPSDIQLTLPNLAEKDMKFQVSYNAPVSAPVKAGQELGLLNVTYPGGATQSYPLVAAKDVPTANFFSRTFEKAMIRVVGAPKYQ